MNPAPTERGGIARIREPGEELLLVDRVAGGEVHLARGPRLFIFVGEVVAVESDLLVGASSTVFGDGVHQELPTERGLLQIQRSGRGVILLELGRGSAFREGSDRRGGGRGVFWPDDLGVAVVA